jgi:hypothetical protein
MASKKQQTFAKLQRERKVKERRQLKQEKKQARKLAGATDDPALTDLADQPDPTSGALPSPPE